MTRLPTGCSLTGMSQAFTPRHSVSVPDQGRPVSAGQVIVVVGASGGLGVSTLAGALALGAAQRSGSSILVDADLAGGGADVTVGVEHLAGPRWPDLAEARGEVDGAALTRLLPSSQGCSVLAADGRRGGDDWGIPSDGADSWRNVLDGLRRTGHPLVVDAVLPRLEALASAGVLSAGGVLLLVGGTDVRRLADLDAAIARLADSGWAQSLGVLVALVTRGRTMPSSVLAAIADQTALPHVGHLLDDLRLVRETERGEWPGSRGRLRRAAAAILDRLDEECRVHRRPISGHLEGSRRTVAGLGQPEEPSLGAGSETVRPRIVTEIPQASAIEATASRAARRTIGTSRAASPGLPPSAA